MFADGTVIPTLPPRTAGGGERPAGAFGARRRAMTSAGRDRGPATQAPRCLAAVLLAAAGAAALAGLVLLWGGGLALALAVYSLGGSLTLLLVASASLLPAATGRRRPDRRAAGAGLRGAAALARAGMATRGRPGHR